MQTEYEIVFLINKVIKKSAEFFFIYAYTKIYFLVLCTLKQGLHKKKYEKIHKFTQCSF